MYNFKVKNMLFLPFGFKLYIRNCYQPMFIDGDRRER